MKRRKRLREGLLHQILRIGRVTRHPQRRRIQLIEERQHITLESLRALLHGLCRARYLTHPLGAGGALIADTVKV
jgi:hypothetical protein